jgi:peptidoglycan L-alanyl-D-glutamate endopeptidase CwlK
MNNKFSSHSKRELNTCDDRLKAIMNRAIIEVDFSIICGFRNQKDQNYAEAMGYSKLKWPNSKHNSLPSLAVDVAPFPINWNDSVRFCELSAIIKRVAEELMIPIVWGGDWVRFPDLPHWQVEK